MLRRSESNTPTLLHENKPNKSHAHSVLNEKKETRELAVWEKESGVHGRTLVP